MSESAVDAVRRLRDVLRTFSQALASGNVEAVLAVELPLADAVQRLPRGPGATEGADRATLRDLANESRELMRRCERLGAAARDMAELSSRFTRHAYGRTGESVRPTVRPTVV